MKKSLTFLFIFLLFSIDSFSQTQNNWDIYNAEKKSEVIAAVLEAAIPVVGHAYAGDANRGIVPALISAGGIVLMFVSVESLSLSGYGLGLVVYLGGRIYGVVSAIQTAEDYNKKLKKKLNLSIVPLKNPNGNVSMGLNLNFSF